MKIGIIGGNSQAASEVAFHLREWGHDVTPIVRNSLAAAFLERHGFDCSVADMTDREQAESTLGELDVVVISAHAPPFSGEIDDPRIARQTNEAIVKHAVKCTPSTARVVYFSTISTYGEELYSSGTSWQLYARQKRHMEDFTLSSCKKASKRGHALRLGLVVGPNQSRTQRIQSALSGEGELSVGVAPNRASNVVHTATLAEAIVRCGDVQSAVYSVLNEPQWSWRGLLEYYAPESRQLVFEGGSDSTSSLLDSALSVGASLVKDYKNDLIPYQVYLPTWFNRQVIHFFRKRNVGEHISTYENRQTATIEEFSYRSLDVDNQLPGLTPTRELLAETPTFDDVFQPKRANGEPQQPAVTDPTDR